MEDLRNADNRTIVEKAKELHSIKCKLQNGFNELKESKLSDLFSNILYLLNKFDTVYNLKSDFKKPLSKDYINIVDQETKRVAKEAGEFVLQEDGNNRYTRFNETGTGFSKVFPVVINSALHFNRFICIEQPELHLHPGLQANLAPMFVKSVNENNNRFVLETHSEHLIKSVQLEVAKYHQSNGEEGISKEDVSLVYISKDSKTGESVVKEMKLDESGSFLEPWPDDFFESSSDLTYERLKLTNKN